MKPLGDPTVRKFVSRDMDSWILPRERSAVQEWETVGRFQFHVMRDHPNHNYPIIAGLWGANNYLNLKRAKMLKVKLFKTRPNDWKYSDQKYLRDEVWPIARYFDGNF